MSSAPRARPRSWPGSAPLLAAALWGGCAAPVSYHRFVAATPYHDAPLPSRAKIFLVAGGTDVANFAAEVAAQRALWRGRGFSEDEIACYWAAPSRAGFRGDRAQFRRVAGELRGCYAATTAQVRGHLARAAAAAPPFLYDYVSSHGLTSLVPENIPKDMLRGPEGALLDQPTLQLGAGPGAGVEAAGLIAALQAGAAPEDLVFAPGVLAGALAAGPTTTPKFVVLQACHAGAFAEALAEVPGVVAVMAARRDRTSFGCDPGRELTIFGAAYLRHLAALLGGGGPAAIDWDALFVDLDREIAAIERAARAEPSAPVMVRGRAP